MVFEAPKQIEINKNRKSIFLGGTIDMGSSDDWQQKLIKDLYQYDFDIYNPRRKSWDSSWIQSFENPQFYQQVNWELDALNKADIVIINFLETSQSPISLLELGLYANSGKLLICCPNKFWRSGNVQIVCNNYNIPLFKDMSKILEYILKNK